MKQHTITINLNNKEYNNLNKLYNSCIYIIPQDLRKRSMSKPDFYKKLLKQGIKQIKKLNR